MTIEVMIIDDAAEVRLLARAFLAGAATVRVYADTASALAGFVDAPAQVVLIDLVLGDECGLALHGALRQLPGGAQARMLAMSACAEEADLARTRAAGFDGHLAKPLTRERLLALVDGSQAGPPRVEVDEMILDLIPEFLTGVSELSRRAVDLSVAGDLVGARRIGHRLAGSGASYGFPYIERLGRQLEHAAVAGDLLEVRRLSRDLCDHAATVQVAARADVPASSLGAPEPSCTAS